MMKRKLLLTILALLCILLGSCGQKQQRPERPTHERITASELEYGEVETGTVPGDYMFQAFNGLLLKYHIPTGTASPVCQDPFCPHERFGSSCPFAISSRLMTSIGNVLYYNLDSSSSDGQHHLRSYDADSMKVEEIYTSNGRLSRIFSYNYYLYFSEHLSTKVEGDIKTTVYRLDTQSGALEIIDCGHPFARMELIEVGRIVWVDDLEYYSTDLDGGDWRVYDQNYCREWGKYKLRWTLGKWTYDKMYCKDLTTGEEVLIAEDVADFYVYGDKLLYVKFVENPQIWITVDGDDHKDLYGGNIYVVDLDGTDSKLLCHVDGFVYGGPSPNRHNEFICGDWVGFISENYYQDKHGNHNLTSTDMLIVNVVTGEYRLIKYNPFE